MLRTLQYHFFNVCIKAGVHATERRLGSLPNACHQHDRLIEVAYLDFYQNSAYSPLYLRSQSELPQR